MQVPACAAQFGFHSLGNPDLSRIAFATPVDVRMAPRQCAGWAWQHRSSASTRERLSSNGSSQALSPKEVFAQIAEREYCFAQADGPMKLIWRLHACPPRTI